MGEAAEDDEEDDSVSIQMVNRQRSPLHKKRSFGLAWIVYIYLCNPHNSFSFTLIMLIRQ